MNLQTIQCFVRVVQTGSFTRAADMLGTQKAHLSRVITQLEKELGVRLLERTTRALSLTEVGREFYARSVGILAEVDDAQRAIQKSQEQPRGTLRLTCAVDFGMIVVSQWINEYMRQYHEMRVDADFTSRIVDIVHEGFDLAIRIGPLPDSSLAARKLGELDYGLFASPHYLSRYGQLTEPVNLEKHHILTYQGSATRTIWVLRKGNSQLEIPLSPRLKASSVTAVRESAIAGLGIAQLPLIVAAQAFSEGKLERVLGDWLPPRIPVHAVFASARYLSPKVKMFVELAAQSMDKVKS
jgi:DNA-binding transcriptional LysR family regulator